LHEFTVTGDAVLNYSFLLFQTIVIPNLPVLSEAEGIWNPFFFHKS